MLKVGMFALIDEDIQQNQRDRELLRSYKSLVGGLLRRRVCWAAWEDVAR